MVISSIKLHNFRNYADLHLQPGAATNVIMGENAQGKTNILEAVHICCLGKSHRGARDTEMVRHNEHSAYIRVEVQRRDGPRSIEVLMEGGKKRISVSGVPIKRMSELMGHVNCVMFSPEDLYLVKGGPGTRRRFLDTSLCQLYPSYYSSLGQYNSALAQRNALLRSKKPDATMLGLFEESMARFGAEVMEKREGFIDGLRATVDGIHANLSGGEAVALHYKKSVQADSAEQLAKALHDSREDDMRRFNTSRGPHRDDMVISLNSTEARIYASQGQQRTAALSIKLAGAELMRSETGEQPVIMLDDVLSELDESRQSALLASVGGQVFITTAGQLPGGVDGAAVFHVCRAKVRPGGSAGSDS